VTKNHASMIARGNRTRRSTVEPAHNPTMQDTGIAPSRIADTTLKVGGPEMSSHPKSKRTVSRIATECSAHQRVSTPAVRASARHVPACAPVANQRSGRITSRSTTETAGDTRTMIAPTAARRLSPAPRTILVYSSKRSCHGVAVVLPPAHSDRGVR
jgi:hypothetical protein